MTKPTETLVEFPRQSARDVLTEVLRTGARQLLAAGDRGRGRRVCCGSGEDG